MNKLEKVLSDILTGKSIIHEQGKKFTCSLAEWQIVLIEEALKLMRDKAPKATVYLIDKTLKTLANF